MQQIEDKKQLPRLPIMAIIIPIITIIVTLLLFLQIIDHNNSDEIDINTGEYLFYPGNLLEKIKSKANDIDGDISIIQQTKNNLKFKIKYQNPGLIEDSIVLNHVKTVINTAITILIESQINPYNNKITIGVEAESNDSTTSAQEIKPPKPYRYNFIRYSYSPRFPTDLHTIIQKQISQHYGKLNIIEMAKDRLSFDFLFNSEKKPTPYKVKKETKKILKKILKILKLYNINYEGGIHGVGGIHVTVKSLVPQYDENSIEISSAYGIAYYNPRKKRIIWSDSYHLSYIEFDLHE
ncbi:hypothetical protein [Spartinivicinus ruber]|uniref:hypothetical protein n=1 Tax=Spartinivicinus ruber TaxID=2683272 RepID=UPI0013CFF444|nr:hypothetical protein [Spartinivicinus ruber]